MKGALLTGLLAVGLATGVPTHRPVDVAKAWTRAMSTGLLGWIGYPPELREARSPGA